MKADLQLGGKVRAAGAYLEQLGGPVLASVESTFPFEPASSIKPLIALYAMTQVEKGLANLTDQVPKIVSPCDCCTPSTTSGTEPLGTAIQEMLQVSDDNRTRELMQYFGVANLNSFAASLGLKNTHFQTAPGSPGFNVIGCLSYPVPPLPKTVDGNTMSLVDVAKLWQDIADLPSPYADALYQLAAGRDMFNSQGSDFVDEWPALVAIAQSEAPSTLTSSQVQSFIDHMTASGKGGGYYGSYTSVCTSGPHCEAYFLIQTGLAQVPSCTGTTMKHTDYLWGFYFDEAQGPYETNVVDAPVGAAYYNLVYSEPFLDTVIQNALDTWSSCAPKSLPTLHVSGTTLTSNSANIDIGTVLANISDSDASDIPSDMSATISWGDGSSTSFGTVTGQKGELTVRGWHSYGASGTYTAAITVTSEATGSSVTASTEITVS